MDKSAKAKLFVVVLLSVLFTAFATHAKEADESQQQPPATGQQPGGDKPAGAQAQPPPETLQILKGTPRPQIMQEMRKIATALGVECNFCHVNPFQTDTPRKAVARLMMRDYTMAMKHKDGSALTCNDCHKGQPNPLRTRPFEGVVGKKMPDRQVLKGMPEERVTQIMNSIAKALGVECNYCHTSNFDDDTPRKQIARFMMTEFSQGLLKNDGSAVGCNDCHQGRARPLASLPFPRRDERRPQPPPEKKPNG
jgi:nitrate/TMAO reductase-like tetraheme cytochrome c subunit